MAVSSHLCRTRNQCSAVCCLLARSCSSFSASSSLSSSSSAALSSGRHSGNQESLMHNALRVRAAGDVECRRDREEASFLNAISMSPSFLGGGLRICKNDITSNPTQSAAATITKRDVLWTRGPLSLSGAYRLHWILCRAWTSKLIRMIQIEANALW